MVDKSNANFVTINFNYLFHIDLKYLFLSFNLIIRKWFLKKCFQKKNIFHAEKTTNFDSETDFFLLFLFYSKTFIFSFKYKIKFQEKI